MQNLDKKKVDRRKIFFSKVKRRILKHVWFVRGLILGFVLLVSYFLIAAGVRSIKDSTIGLYINLAGDFLFTPEEKIESIAGRTNILILGKGGGEHEAPDLTDTIIFASLEHPKGGLVGEKKEGKVTLVSLPRDIWIPELRAKLNSAYYWGNQKKPPKEDGVGGGLLLAGSTVEEILDEPIQYEAVVDFELFKNIIDIFEGIEVEVENSFVDERYPIPGKENDDCGGDDPEFKCRYETIRFDEGLQFMDGDTALKFVRSRNAEGDEGTDFARAKRQQKVIEAIKNRVFSREILFSLSKLTALKNAVINNVETDIDPASGAILARYLYEARDNVDSHVLPEEFLENPPISPEYDNLYVFIPKNEDWSRVHEWVECVLSGGECK